jgi:xanthine/uracil permease
LLKIDVLTFNCVGLRIVRFWLNITVDRRVRTVSAGASVGTGVSIGLNITVDRSIRTIIIQISSSGDKRP